MPTEATRLARLLIKKIGKFKDACRGIDEDRASSALWGIYATAASQIYRREITVIISINKGDYYGKHKHYAISWHAGSCART